MKDGRLRIKRMDAEFEQVGVDIYGMDYYADSFDKRVGWYRKVVDSLEIYGRFVYKMVGSFPGMVSLLSLSLYL